MQGQNITTKSNSRRQGFHLTLPHHSPPSKKVRTGTQTGTGRQELKHRPWRSTVYWTDLHGLLSLSSYSIQDYLCHHPQWFGPSPTNHQSRKCTTGLITGQSGRDIFLVKVPYSKMSLTHVRSTQNYPTDTKPLPVLNNICSWKHTTQKHTVYRHTHICTDT